MSLGDIVVLLLIAAACLLAFRSIRKSRKVGCGGCCAACSQPCAHKQGEKREERWK